MEPITDRTPLLTADDVATHLGVPASTLANWRYQGLGPRYLRIGRHVRYDPVDVDAWIESQRVRQRGSVR
jgi:predicted DNA-binding transcriptional regulator AlpA